MAPIGARGGGTNAVCKPDNSSDCSRRAASIRNPLVVRWRADVLLVSLEGVDAVAVQRCGHSQAEGNVNRRRSYYGLRSVVFIERTHDQGRMEHG